MKTITINGNSYPIKVSYGVFKKYLQSLKDKNVNMDNVFEFGLAAMDVLELTAVNAINAGYKSEGRAQDMTLKVLLNEIEEDDDCYLELRDLLNEGIEKFQPKEEGTELGK